MHIIVRFTDGYDSYSMNSVSTFQEISFAAWRQYGTHLVIGSEKSIHPWKSHNKGKFILLLVQTGISIWPLKNWEANVVRGESGWESRPLVPTSEFTLWEVWTAHLLPFSKSVHAAARLFLHPPPVLAPAPCKNLSFTFWSSHPSEYRELDLSHHGKLSPRPYNL